MERCGIADSWMIHRLQRNVANDIACAEMPYEKVLEVIQKWHVFEDWTVYEINNRPVDIDGLSELIAEELS